MHKLNYSSIFFAVPALLLITHPGYVLAGSTWPADSTWNTPYNTLSIHIRNGQVSATYDYVEGKLDGKLSADAKTLSGYWHQSNGRGKYTFTISLDGKSFTGLWGRGEAEPTSSGWNGKLLSRSVDIASAPVKTPSAGATSKPAKTPSAGATSSPGKITNPKNTSTSGNPSSTGRNAIAMDNYTTLLRSEFMIATQRDDDGTIWHERWYRMGKDKTDGKWRFDVYSHCISDGKITQKYHTTAVLEEGAENTDIKFSVEGYPGLAFIIWDDASHTPSDGMPGSPRTGGRWYSGHGHVSGDGYSGGDHACVLWVSYASGYNIPVADRDKFQ